MCVICIADKGKRPSAKMVEEMWKRNDHGGGIAYRIDGENGTKLVEWKKGLNLDEMKHLCATLPLPYVAHFRITSSDGGDRRDSLCHPFEISESPSQGLSGVTSGDVLFHNGNWKDWGPLVIQASLKSGYPIPPGKFSDTRAMAFLSHVMGRYFMDFINQKGVVFGPNDYELFWGSEGWKNIGGLMCSNDKFVSTVFQGFGNHNRSFNEGDKSAHNSPTVCRARACGVSVQPVQKGYCEKHGHMREVPKLLPPGKMLEGQNVVCMECSAVLSAGQKHSISCSRHPAKAKGKDTKPIVCVSCKRELTTGTEHTEDCHLKSYGLMVEMGPTKATGLAGGQPIPDPFQVVLSAEKAKEAGKFGKKAFRKIAERWGFGNGKWTWEKMAREKKEFETTTVH